MERKTFKILFYIMKTRVSKSGESPILLRVTVNGLRAMTTTNFKVNPDLWHSTLGKSLGTDATAEELNDHLDLIKVRIMQINKELQLEGMEVTAQKIIDKYQGRDEKPGMTLLNIFQEHNERCAKLAGKDMSPATVERYETCYRHTQEFIRNSYGKEDILLEEVNHKFIVDYEFFLKTERNCCHNTATKYLKNFKKIIRIALANEWIKKDPFANIRFHLDEVEPDFLEDHEIKKIIEKPISIERLAVVRDTFIFCCFTGLAFSDVKGLSHEHLSIDNNGALWIRKRRQKTKNMCNIPLLDIPKQILERYKEHPQCIKNSTLLPVPTNQKMNSYLKEIADICGIEKELRTHTGRHSYATSVCLANGVTMENVAKMLGHSDTKMTRHYARVLDKSIMRDMTGVNAKFSLQKEA